MQRILNSYSIIIELNETIKSIQFFSFKIKLRAMNSLIALQKSKTAGASGFSAVSKDLMDFSEKMATKSEDLQERIQNIIITTTRVKKMERIFRLMERSGHPIGSEKEIEYSNHLGAIQSLEKELSKSVQDSIRLCKLGNVVVVCSKIEAAYMKEESDFYTKLSEDVGNSIQSILDGFIKIQKTAKEQI
jgi:hypothetical protein